MYHILKGKIQNLKEEGEGVGGVIGEREEEL